MCEQLYEEILRDRPSSIQSFRNSGNYSFGGNPKGDGGIFSLGMMNDLMSSAHSRNTSISSISSFQSQDPAARSVSQSYFDWAVDMTLYYFALCAIRERHGASAIDTMIGGSMEDAAGYFAFQYPRPEKWCQTHSQQQMWGVSLGQEQGMQMGEKQENEKCDLFEKYSAWRADQSDAGVEIEGLETSMREEMMQMENATPTGFCVTDKNQAGQMDAGMEELSMWMKAVVL